MATPSKSLEEAWDATPAAPVPDLEALWDATPEPAPDPKTKAESATRGALQGASLGWADEGAATLAAAMPGLTRSFSRAMYGDEGELAAAPHDADFAMRKAAALEYYRRQNKQAAADNPKTYLAGEVGGGLVTSLAAPGGAVKAAGNLRKATLLSRGLRGGATGAGAGAVSGLGHSEGSAGQQALDTLAGAGTGGVLGGVTAAGSPAVESLLRRVAVAQGRKALTGVGNPLSAKAPLPDDAVQAALDAGAVKGLGTATGAAKRLDVATGKASDAYETMLNALEEAGVEGPVIAKAAEKLRAAANEVEANAAKTSIPGFLRGHADAIAAKAPVKQAGNEWSAPFKSKNGDWFWDYPEWAAKRETDSAYRGVTSEEMSSILKSGKIQSTGAYSTRGEGTSLADNAADALSYVQVGRDNPARTGLPVFVIKIRRPSAAKVDRDGYLKTQDPVPVQDILETWEFRPDGTVSGSIPPVVSRGGGLAPGGERLGLEQARKMRALLQREAPYGAAPGSISASGAAKQDVARMLNESIDEGVLEQVSKAPALVGRFAPQRKELSLLIRALETAQAAANKEAKRKTIGLLPTLAAVGGGSAGGIPGALLAGVGMSLADRRLASTLAAMARRGGQVAGAAAASPEVTGAVAGQVEPEIMALIRALRESKDGTNGP